MSLATTDSPGLTLADFKQAHKQTIDALNESKKHQLAAHEWEKSAKEAKFEHKLLAQQAESDGKLARAEAEKADEKLARVKAEKELQAVEKQAKINQLQADLQEATKPRLSRLRTPSHAQCIAPSSVPAPTAAMTPCSAAPFFSDAVAFSSRAASSFVNKMKKPELQAFADKHGINTTESDGTRTTAPLLRNKIFNHMSMKAVGAAAEAEKGGDDSSL